MPKLLRIECKSFDEYDNYAQAIRGIKSEGYVYKLAEQRWTLYHTCVGEASLQVGVSKSGHILDAADTSGHWSVLVHISGERPRVIGGFLPQNAALLVAPRARFIYAAPGPHTWFLVSLADIESTNDAGNKTGRETRIVPLTASQLRQFKSWARVLSHNGRKSFSVLRKEIGELGGCLLNQAELSRHVTGRPSLDRAVILSQAKFCITSDPELNPALDQLSVAAGIANRTLRKVFVECYGMPPREFVMLRRLHACRSTLREANPKKVRIRDIAARFGFRDFGRFSAYYRELFLELPSSTLDR